MNKFLKEKNFFKKIIIIILILFLFQIIIPNTVKATVASTLLEPVMNLLVAIGDGILDVLNSSIMNQDVSLIPVGSAPGFWARVGIAIVAIVAAITVIVLIGSGIGAIAGTALAFLLSSSLVTSALATCVAIGGITSGLWVGNYISNVFYPDTLYLPTYSISPEEIFKGQVPMFSVNFFEYEEIGEVTSGNNIYGIQFISTAGESYMTEYLGSTNAVIDSNTYDTYYDRLDSGELTYEVWHGNNSISNTITEYTDYVFVSYYDEGNYEYEDASIYSVIPIYYDENGNEISEEDADTINLTISSPAYQLRDTISKWYNSLRNIALVFMLSILLYVGIRILLSSIASDKAKYKQMLQDWFIGMILLFFMHYIMIFAVQIVEMVTESLSGLDEVNGVIIALEDTTFGDGTVLSESVAEINEDFIVEEDGVEYITWITNVMGGVRLNLQITEDGVQNIGYAICFFVLVLYTIFFAFTYIKRVIYMAFLTMIAPLVAMTYPIDKLTDGKAQGFDSWLKEYIFNLLLQPLHLILYTILVGSVFDFAGENIIYMLVAIGFMVPAEKVLRGFFGFSKSSTAGSLSTAVAGGAMVSGMLKNFAGKGSKGGHNNEISEKDDKINMLEDSSFNPIDTLSNDLLGEESDEISNINNETRDNNETERNESQNTNSEMGEDLSQNKNNDLGMSEEEIDNIFRAGGYTEEQIKEERQDREETRRQNQPEQNSAPTAENKQDKSAEKKPAKLAQQKPKQPEQNAQTKTGGTPEPSRFTRIKRAANVGIRRQKEAVRKEMNNKNKEGRQNSKRIVKNSMKMAGGLSTAALAGTIGLSAGIATGDISNAAKFTTAGAVAGYGTGSMLTSNIANDSNVADDTRAMYKAYKGEEKWKEKQIEKQIKEYKKDSKKMEELEAKVGYVETKQMIKDKTLDTYLRNGVTEAGDIKALEQLKQDNTTETVKGDTKNAIAVQKYSSRIGDTRNMEPDKRDKHVKNWAKEIETAGKGKISSDAAQRKAQAIMNDTIRYNTNKA